MYLIPKNIRVKREVFKGFGMIEIGVMAVSMGIGYLLSLLASGFQAKVFLFSFLPLTTFILLVPLPTNGTALNILIKFIRYQTNQKKYKKYEEEKQIWIK